jgi:hypothetical protein
VLVWALADSPKEIMSAEIKNESDTPSVEHQTLFLETMATWVVPAPGEILNINTFGGDDGRGKNGWWQFVSVMPDGRWKMERPIVNAKVNTDAGMV